MNDSRRDGAMHRLSVRSAAVNLVEIVQSAPNKARYAPHAHTPDPPGPHYQQPALALAFEAHGTMLRVTGVRELTPPPYSVLGWSVPDIAAAVRDLEARGVAFARYVS
jgi:hypothetical protein